MPWQPGEASAPQPIVAGPYEYLSGDEATFLDAAVARVIPNDELGPGAKEAGVTTFFDRQLAGPYGNSSESARDNKGASGTIRTARAADVKGRGWPMQAF